MKQKINSKFIYIICMKHENISYFVSMIALYLPAVYNMNALNKSEYTTNSMVKIISNEDLTYSWVIIDVTFVSVFLFSVSATNSHIIRRVNKIWISNLFFCYEIAHKFKFYCSNLYQSIFKKKIIIANLKCVWWFQMTILRMNSDEEKNY